MHVQIFCFSSSYLSLLHEKIYCHSLFIYMEKWVSIKWVPMCLNTIILGVPLPKGVSATHGEIPARVFYNITTIVMGLKNN